jgi:hypothetical protein
LRELLNPNQENETT